MKIIKTEQYIFDNEDRRLLSIELPDNPCDNYSLKKNECCWCSDVDKYAKTVKLYKERNIYDLALKIKSMHNL